jgi:hypothetical protein
MLNTLVAAPETVTGPCPEILITPANRPRLLTRGSVHPAVRDAQRRINAFSLAEVAAGRPSISDTPLREDCVFGSATQRALIAFQQRVFPGRPVEHDGQLGLRTWAEFDRVATPQPAQPPTPTPPPIPASTPPAPPSPTMTGPRSISRPCCMLASLSLAGLATIGGHGSSQPGIVYTGRAGFVDLGHLWEVVEMTAFAYQQIHSTGGAAGTAVRAVEGTATLTSTAPAAEWLDLARSIAFDDSLSHEIATYTVMRPGGHNSSFSPEDLCSNYLGTVIAARTLTAGGTFVAEAERQLRTTLTSLDAQSDTETRASFARISRRWVDVSLFGTVTRHGYLRRRNFTRDPWKTGHPSDAATPAFVVAPITITSTYDYIHPTGFTRADLTTQIAAIKADAATRYGPNFDRP